MSPTTAERQGRPTPKPKRALRVGFVSLGCAKNLVDTEVMLGHLDRAGHSFVQDPADADVIVVNTCAFIEAAREESIQAILEAGQLKQSGKLQRVVVAGCMVQRYSAELRAELPEVDAFIDLDELDQIADCVDGPAASCAAPVPAPAGRPAPLGDLPLVSSGAQRSTAGSAGPTAVAAWSAAASAPAARSGQATYLYDDTTPRIRATPPWTAYVKIAEGCNHTCSFCAIPRFRGLFRSRTPESIVRECAALTGQGVREINLIAQDSSHYGRDLDLREGLAELLRALDGVPDLRWLRVHYLYPNTITPRLIEAMAELPRVVNYVDLPLQHAHPETLRRMRRGGSAASHLRLLGSFRAAMSDVALRSTFIVGFPGETEEEFQCLLDFVEAARLDHLGVFTYSHEESTTAREYVDDVPADLKAERRGRLMELQQRIVFDRNRLALGRRVEVLLEGAHAETEHLLVGRTRGQAPEVDGQILINDTGDTAAAAEAALAGGLALPGRFVMVELTETAGYDMVGRIVGPA